SEPSRPEPIEKIGANLFRVGRVRVDTAAREVSVSGHLKEHVRTLEVVANPVGAMKAYESALTLDTDAITFNTALVQIGLDKAHAVLPKFHSDPAAVEGDPVDMWIDCPGGECQRMRLEHLMFDQVANEPVHDGRWVYTGSTVLPDGKYRAQL